MTLSSLDSVYINNYLLENMSASSVQMRVQYFSKLFNISNLLKIQLNRGGNIPFKSPTVMYYVHYVTTGIVRAVVQHS